MTKKVYFKSDALLKGTSKYQQISSANFQLKDVSW